MIIDNLEKLNPNDYKDDPKSVEIINDWKERVPMLAAKLDFKEHPITSEIAFLTKQEIERIKNTLINKEEMSEVERIGLLKEKKVHEFYLGLFTYDPTPELEVLDRQISEELSETN